MREDAPCKGGMLRQRLGWEKNDVSRLDDDPRDQRAILKA